MIPHGKTLASFSFALLAFVALDAAAQDARWWLDRMNRAVEELNYEGTYVHVLGDNSETMHIVHRNHGGRISERLVSMDGIGREIIREENVVRVIFPDQRLVLLETRDGTNPLLSALPSYSAELEPHYEFTMYPNSARVAKHPVQIIGIKAKDEYRYGYTLWLDRDTAMPLKSLLQNEHGEVIEQILFTQIQYSDFIPASALHPAIDTEGFTFLRSPEPAEADDSTPSWRASMLPRGFKLSAATQSSIAGSEYPVAHLVYSDGLATVSVFIEDPKTNAEVAEGFSRLGITNAYSLTLNGRKVTAIGEVPQQTVRSIAMSLSAE